MDSQSESLKGDPLNGVSLQDLEVRLLLIGLGMYNQKEKKMREMGYELYSRKQDVKVYECWLRKIERTLNQLAILNDM
jgi:hypothetical protein